MRQSKVVGFSIPPELHARFEKVLSTKHKTRSEFFREVLDAYLSRPGGGGVPHAPAEADVAHALRAYWDLRSSTSQKVIIVGVAVISHEGKVLIGARKEKDEWIENLSWVFPGGQLNTLNFDQEVQSIVKRETQINVEVKNLIAARVHPDSGFKEVQVVALYFNCVPAKKSKDAKEKPGKDLTDLKWVKPSDVFKYFTTSVTDEVTKFLLMIEKDHMM